MKIKNNFQYFNKLKQMKKKYLILVFVFLINIISVNAIDMSIESKCNFSDLTKYSIVDRFNRPDNLTLGDAEYPFLPWNEEVQEDAIDVRILNNSIRLNYMGQAKLLDFLDYIDYNFIIEQDIIIRDFGDQGIIILDLRDSDYIMLTTTIDSIGGLNGMAVFLDLNKYYKFKHIVYIQNETYDLIVYNSSEIKYQEYGIEFSDKEIYEFTTLSKMFFSANSATPEYNSTVDVLSVYAINGTEGCPLMYNITEPEEEPLIEEELNYGTGTIIVLSLISIIYILGLIVLIFKLMQEGKIISMIITALLGTIFAVIIITMINSLT